MKIYPGAIIPRDMIEEILIHSGAVSISELIEVYKQKNKQEIYNNGFAAGYNAGLERGAVITKRMYEYQSEVLHVAGERIAQAIRAEAQKGKI